MLDKASIGLKSVARGVIVRDLRVSLLVPVLRGVDLEATPGAHLAIVGPSGCGKTTLLRSIAGLQRIHSGGVWLGDKRVAGSDVHVAPEDRRVGLVFQDSALFPHLTVAANVAYGLPRNQRSSRFRRGHLHANKAVRSLLEMVGVAELADRFPGSLSGGQQQRVALARALAPQPSVMLFDEPFSSLDAHLRVGLRTEVVSLLRSLEITSIFVTHDQDEAFVLGDEVAVMREGVIVQQATPAELYIRPVDSWLAEFVGEAELVPGHASEGIAATTIGPVPLADQGAGEVRVLVRPEEIVLSAGRDATVVEVQYYGHDTLTRVQMHDGVVLRSRSTGAPRFAVASEVGVSHSGTRARSYPAGGTEAPTQPTVVDSETYIVS